MSTSSRLHVRPAASLVFRGIAALGIAAAGCDSATEPLTTFWEGSLEPVLPATVTGRVVALTRAGRTQASIVVEGAEAEAVYAWHISEGTCDAEGDLQGGPNSYPNLVPGVGGSASAEAAFPDLFRSGQRFAARVVLRPEAGPDRLVACGSLQETDGG